MNDKTKNQPIDKVHGEGNYEASREYNEATRQFVKAGKVDEAVRKAAPKTPEEAAEMERAERAGKAPMKEEDPALQDQKKASTTGSPTGSDPS